MNNASRGIEEAMQCATGYIESAKKFSMIQEAISKGLLGKYAIEKEEMDQITVDELERLLSGEAMPFCRKQKDCGHRCAGVMKEGKCLPCLEPECLAAEESKLPTSHELCTICYTSELREEPSVQLSCGHIFHANCIKQLL